MPKITFETDDIDFEEVKYDVTRALLEEIADDIYHDNTEWWAEQICKPLLTNIKEELNKPDNSLLKELFNELVIDYLDEVSVKDIVKEVVEEHIKDRVEDLLTAFINSKK